MPGQFVQASSLGTTTSSSPTTCSFISAPTKGDLIVVATALIAGAVPISVTDTQGNTFTQVGTTGIYWAISNGVTVSEVITFNTTVVLNSVVLVGAVEYLGPWSTTLFIDNSTTKIIAGNPSIAYTLPRSSAAHLTIPDLVVTSNAATSGGQVTWSGLSGTDRFGTAATFFEFNDFIQPSGGASITATSSNGTGTVTSSSVSFFTITEPGLVSTYAIDDILSIVNDELHGKKNAFSESQKIRHINKALDEMWKIMKVLHQGYWMTNNTPGLVLDLVNTDFILPVDFSEVRLIEVTNPIDYVGIDVVRMYMNSGVFKSERQSFRAAQTVATADSVLVIPGQLNYDIYGPDASNQMHMLFSRPAPVPLTLLIWYIRLVGHFSVPKLASETLQSLLSPYIWDLAVYAAKSLLKSENSDQGEFAKWEEQWSKGIDRSMPAAHERATADDDTVEGFVEL